MKIMSSKLFLLLSLLFLLSQTSLSATIIVDGVSEWKNPTVHIGDSIIFKHKYHYKLYIFKNQNAFNLCNFTQGTILTKQNSTSYTWYPSRPGFFYFTFNNGSLKTCSETSQKLSIKVTPAPPPAAPPRTVPPLVSPNPAPTSGGDIDASPPPYPWPFQPHEEAASSPAPGPSSNGANSPLTVPNLVPDKGGGMPFINSNPAVPLPTGEVDSATIRPLPTSGHHQPVAVGLFGVHMTTIAMLLLLLLL